MDEAEKEGEEIIEVPAPVLVGLEPEILDRGEQYGDRDEELDQIRGDIDDMQCRKGECYAMADSKGRNEDQDLFPV